jgi:hypothetical protein
MNPVYQLPRKREVRAKAWREIIESFEQSGLNLETFCQKVEVFPESLLKWKGIFEREKKEVFIPVEIKDVSNVLEEHYEFRHRNGLSLLCTGKENEGTLRKLLKIMGGAI